MVSGRQGGGREDARRELIGEEVHPSSTQTGALKGRHKEQTVTQGEDVKRIGPGTGRMMQEKENVRMEIGMGLVSGEVVLGLASERMGGSNICGA